MAEDKQRSVPELLKQMENFDPDERFMALRDLHQRLVDRVEISSNYHASVSDKAMELLEDKNSDVSTMATKCLQALVNVFPPEEARKVVDRLSSLIVGDEIPKLRRRKSAYRKDKEESKASIDTWAGGLRGLMLSLDAENGRALADQLVGKLLHGLESPPAGREPDDVSFEMVCLDLLQVLLRRFAEQCTSQYDRLVTVTTGLLSHDDMDLRSRANTVLGGVVAFVPEEMFSSLMQKLIAEINASSASSPALFTYIQSIGQISGAAGLRVGKYLDQIVPKLLELCKRDSAAQQGDDMEEEPESTKQLWEVCLQAFEALIERCPQAVDQYVRQLVDIALDLIRYDPRFVAPADAGGDGSGGDAGAEDGGDEWGGGDGWGDDGDDGWGDDDDAGDADDAGDGSDDAWGAEDAVVGDVINQSDDDTSWRVRRAAVNVISAFVRVRSDILRESYGGLMTSLVDRFSERDASVLEEVVFCTRDLLHESVVSKKDIDMDRDAALSVPVIVRARSSYQTMDDKVEEVVTSAHRVFPSAALNVKKAIYSLLRELLIVRHKSGDLGPHLSVLIPDMVEGITHKDSSFKQDALNLLHLTLEFHGAELVAPFLEDLTAAVSKCVSETHNPNCKATGLRVLGVVSRRVQGDQIERVAAGAYESTLAELKVRDADQAVKNAAIATMAVVISHFGEHLDAHVDDVVTIFIDRLSNPITRVPALQALTDCAEADVRLSSVINDASLVKIGAFLRKKKSEQKHAAAVALEALVKHCSDLIANKDETFAALFKEATPFLSDGDLHLSHLLLDFFTTSVAHHAPAADLLAEGELHSQLHALIVSPLLQGAALESMLGLYRQLATSAVENKQSKVTFKSLVEELRASALPESNGTVLRNIARCHAALTQQSGDDEANRTVKECEKAATSKSQPSHLRVLALLTLGEIGRQVDLRSHKKLEPAVFGAFSDPASEVRLAASFALGSITCGALDHYLSRVLVLAEKHPDQRFLLLDALRETILQHQSDLDHELAFREHSGSVLPLLLETAQSADAGPRNMAAECLGRLAVIDSDTLSPELATLCSGDVNQRHVATLALRFAVSADAVPRAMTSAVDEFIKLINDEDLEVRRQALITVGAVTKANVAMLDSHLREVVLPALSKGTIIDESLVEEVDYGAFKETVDHGLAVRTTAFECLETILVEAPHRIKFSDFMEDVKRGLQEKNQDIKVITYRILRHLAEVHPSELLESLDTFSGAITKGIKPLFKLQNNDGQVGQAAKRLLTTVVEVLYIIMDIHGIEMCPKFCKFHRQVKATKALKAIIAEHEQQRKEQGL